MEGRSKKGSSRLLCMQPLHILCNNTQKSRPLFGPRAACTAPEKVDSSSALMSGKSGALEGVSNEERLEGEQGRPFCPFLCRLGAGRGLVAAAQCGKAA